MQFSEEELNKLTDEEILNWLEFLQDLSLLFMKKIIKAENEIKFLEELYGRDFNK